MLGCIAWEGVSDCSLCAFRSEDAHLMWYERVYVGLLSFEKYVVYPAIVLSALTNDGFALSHRKKLGIQ